MESEAADSISEQRPRVKYVSAAEPSGYGASAIAYMNGLREAGVPLSWTPLFQGPQGYMTAPSPSAALERLAGLNIAPETAALYGAVEDTREGEVCVLHSIPELWPRFRQSQGPHIGYTVWETTSLPPHWPAVVSTMDRLLMPSVVSADAFRAANLSVPIDVVPHIYRPSSPGADGARFREAHGIPADHTVFYSISTWTARKAVWSTLHAYCSAFTNRDATTLVVKTDFVGPAHDGDGIRRPVQRLVRDLVETYPQAPRVCLIVRSLSQTEIEDLQAAGDCFVSLTRAEGWGLGAFDAACAGKPVIITGWGGQLDYLGSDDELLVRYQLVPVRDRLGAGSYRPDQRWAVADLGDAIDKMRWVHEHRTEAAVRSEARSARLKAEFASERITARLMEILGV